MIAPGGSLAVRTRFTACLSRRPVRRLRLDRRAADGRDRRVLPVHPAAGAGRRPAARAAPGVCRAALDQAVLSLQRGALARRRPGRSGAAAGTAAWAQRRLATRLPPRRAQRARQVGVPVVRRLGHRVSLHRAGPARPGVGQAAGGAPACASGTCTPAASSRPTSGISRTPIRRCTPTPPGGSTRSPAT